ncbi:MAG: tRNA (adenosine(37)-N6)-threonylcarbamoyltransferase complex dimerization subunit type 1 TsaB [Ktedonobacteraceae bacterium]|nr:tRNA (adenosine(37)-N6)-threonylcarbamoyltransferase complex dimerization subunit type 1 TsaB [Ktedonobacteraceae bacterium]
MLLLALDTSTRQASIALCTEDELLGEYTWRVGNNHSVQLLTHIQRLLAECDTAMHAIDAIAVATGPGSFNGLRVALATAKALAFALKKPLLGIGTLDLSAAQQRHWHGPICSLLEAGRAELYAACYVFDELPGAPGTLTHTMQRLSDSLLLTPQQLVTYLKEQAGAWVAVPGQRQLPPFLFCGEISPASRQALSTLLPADAFFVENIQAARHASVLAMLAWQRLQNGETDDPLLLEPLYLRRPSITTSTRKQPLLGGSSRPATDQSQTEREEGALRH